MARIVKTRQAGKPGRERDEFTCQEAQYGYFEFKRGRKKVSAHPLRSLGGLGLLRQTLLGRQLGFNRTGTVLAGGLQNAAETMDNGGSRDWTRLSMNLGYYDQSHFIKDFKAIIGKTPDEYVKAQL
jgi:hypothetical protein